VSPRHRSHVPRHRSSKPSFHNRYRFLRRPSRLTLGVAAATVAGIAGVWAGLSSSATPPVGAAGSLDAISRAGAPHAPDHASAAHAAGHAGSRSAHAIATHAPPRRQSPSKVPAPTEHPGRKAAVQKSARPEHRAAVPHPVKAAPAKPYLIYDSVLPTAIPANNMVATYATGPYAASPSQVAGRQVIWIDVYGTDYGASALDVEPSDATPDQAASWAYHRLKLHPTELAHIYTSISEWPQVQAACAALPAWMQSHIRWWIADPTGFPHIVPGSDATQWYWGSSYDISTATRRF
jgi:hypothetical protein